ncbi:hypothetical protein LOD99_4668 [Oopsacas minuta]|uniref:EF-hand domain-containing protein n=1 Tax=Oopsacas minuta TaxID=111878 RepID=A0AAV7JT23_9METZ|nr:hypothetical protein LOD99_4668 [Oopsacas minuta]
MASSSISHSLEKEFSQSELRDLSELFDACDLTSKQYIDLNTLRAMFCLLGYQASHKPTLAIVKDLDLNHKKLSFEDFLQCLVVKQGDTYDPYSELKHVFDRLSEGKEDIDQDTLVRKCRELGVSLSLQQVREMMDIADRNGDGLVNLQEFITIMMQTNLFQFLR